MRPIIVSLTFVAASLGLAAPSVAAEIPWRISQAAGPVRVTAGLQVREGRPGLALPAGATIQTGQGARALIVRGQEFVIVAPLSQIRLPQSQARNGLIQILEDWGMAVFKIEHKSTPHFGVQTPFFAAAVKGTTFRVSVAKDGASVRVREGAVAVQTAKGEAVRMVPAGMKASVERVHPNVLLVQPAPAGTGDVAVESDLLSLVPGAAAADAPAGESSGLTLPSLPGLPHIPFAWLMLGAALILGLLFVISSRRRSAAALGADLARGSVRFSTRPSGDDVAPQRQKRKPTPPPGGYAKPVDDKAASDLDPERLRALARHAREMAAEADSNEDRLGLLEVAERHEEHLQELLRKGH
jgi:hypothetical protein